MFLYRGAFKMFYDGNAGIKGDIGSKGDKGEIGAGIPGTAGPNGEGKYVLPVPS
jgi:hypothetical protein